MALMQSAGMPNVLSKVFGATLQHYEVKRIKSWMNQFRSRRYIQIDNLLTKDRKLPTPANLIIRINQLTNLGDIFGEVPDATLHLQLNATLAYCEEYPAPARLPKRGQQAPKKGKVHFFGRTYSSKLLEVKKLQNTLSLKQPHYLYVNVTEQIKKLSLIIEVIISRTNEQNVIIDQSGVGWVMIDDILNKGIEETFNFRKSSPRLLLHEYDAFNHCKLQEGLIKVKIQKSTKFYLPIIRPYTLVGPNDIIPGIEDQQLPPRITSDTQLKFARTVTLFIKNGIITVSNDLEDTLIGTIKKYRQQLYSDHQGQPKNKDSQQFVEITERRLIVGAHNTWDFINKNGNKNYIAMSPPDPESHQSSLAGILKVEDITMDDNVALIFKLQYSVKIKSQKSASDNLTFVLGWLIHIPSVNQIGQWSEKQISCEFILGPGVTITGDMLWDANYNISMEQQKKHFIHFNAFLSKSDQMMAMSSTNMMMESSAQGNQLTNQRQRNYQNIIKDLSRKNQQSEEVINRQQQMITNQSTNVQQQKQVFRKQMELMKSHHDDGQRAID